MIVQTPLRIINEEVNNYMAIGDAVFMRPAKAGEIAERFQHYLLLSSKHTTPTTIACNKTSDNTTSDNSCNNNNNKNTSNSDNIDEYHLVEIANTYRGYGKCFF